MSLPLPPTNPNLTVPSRIVDNNRRLRRREGLTLPTPRTYRTNAAGNIGTTSGTNFLTLLTLKIFMQPNEILAVGFAGAFRATAASTGARVVLNSGPYPDYEVLFPWTVTTTAVPWTRAANPSGGTNTSAPSVIHAGEFIYFLPYTDSSSGVVQGPTTPTEYTMLFRLQRSSGAGNITASDAFAWAMLL